MEMRIVEGCRKVDWTYCRIVGEDSSDKRNRNRSRFSGSDVIFSLSRSTSITAANQTEINPLNQVGVSMGE